VPGGLLNLIPCIVLAVEIEDIRHEVERMAVVIDLRIEPSQVEPVGQVLLVDFAKVLVAARGYELRGGLSARGCRK
jgi:hypothetical protein